MNNLIKSLKIENMKTGRYGNYYLIYKYFLNIMADIVGQAN